MKRFLLITSCLLVPAVALAQMASPTPSYSECTALASSNPATALERADTWLKYDTGIAPQHCRAMALYGLRRFSEAAEALSRVRDSLGRDNISMRSYVTRQAAQAYTNANQVDRALAMLSSQIDDMGNYRGDNAQIARLTSELLVERAKLNVNYGKLSDSAKDLDHAVSLTPLNETVLAERALLFEKMGDRSLARSDAENVLKLNTSNIAAREILTRMGITPPPVTSLAAAQAATEPAAAPKKTYKRKRVAKPATIVETPAIPAPEVPVATPVATMPKPVTAPSVTVPTPAVSTPMPAATPTAMPAPPPPVQAPTAAVTPAATPMTLPPPPSLPVPPKP